jgi:hypothetical protein
MTHPHSRRGPLSTIAGWMVLIAVLGVIMGIMTVAPYLFILVLLVAPEAVAVIKFRESRRRNQAMSGCVVTAWVLAFTIVIPVVSIVAGVVALVAYCTVNPRAFQ